ncbi:hypothetical protein H0H92_014693 [Tricholoma furcatifolium]|nr:hypothetical protein H0H92_014693 [Tricholoma furcatifolium]
MSSPSYLLRLGKTALIFFPPYYLDATSEHPTTETQVIQVTIKAQYASILTSVHVDHKGHRNIDKQCIDLFYRNERSITAAIESVLLAHMVAPLPERVNMEDEGYTLHGTRVPWTYGAKKVKFTWGNQDLRAADDKWVFVIEPSVSG